MTVFEPALTGVSGRSGAATGQRSALVPIVAGALAVILLVSAADAALRGPWLDEFWTLELSDKRKGLGALARDGWLRDTHPVPFNLWATFLSSIGITSIPLARLATNLPAAGLMIGAAVLFSRRRPVDAGYHAAMLLLVLSLPQAIEGFANYRSYFWQLACLASLAALARHIAATEADLDLRRDGPLVVVAVLAIAGAMALHYIGAVFGGLLAGAVFLCAVARGHRRWSTLVAATAVAAFLQVVAVALLQSRNWPVDLDHSWIEAQPILTVLAVPLALVAGALGHNPVPLAALWPGSHRWTGPERTFVATMAGVLVVGVALVVALDAFRPIMVERYLIAVPVLVSAIMASLAARIAYRRLVVGLLALFAVGVAAGHFVLHGAKPEWNEAARSVARMVEACPTTRIYAASGWSVGPNAETRAARREDPVFRRAYDQLAGRHGYAVRYLGQDEVTWARPGRCPVLVWFEHTPNEAEDDPRAALEMSGVWGLEEARLSVIRSRTGFVVRAEPPVEQARAGSPHDGQERHYQ